jgi:tyrosinase
MATGAPSPQHASVPIRYRPSVAELTAAQLAELRAAFQAVQQITDDRGYQYFAGIHGLPLPVWCDINGHGTPTFLHWHRAYLWRFERALRATGHDVMLPWWDWVATPEIPAAYKASRGADGKANPLRSVRINPLALQQGAKAPAGSSTRELSRKRTTFREPGRPGTMLPTKADIDEVLAYPDFSRFTSNLEDWHGQIHVWVGGHMGDIAYAAYDPIFWAHHTMIDRLWRIWQLNHHSASLPRSLTDLVMQPFHMTAAKTIEVAALGYDYAISATDIPVRP